MSFFLQKKNIHPLSALQVSKEYTALLKMDVMVHLETQVSLGNLAGQEVQGIKDPQESATQQRARALRLMGNHPTLKTIKRRRRHLFRNTPAPQGMKIERDFF